MKILPPFVKNGDEIGERRCRKLFSYIYSLALGFANINGKTAQRTEISQRNVLWI